MYEVQVAMHQADELRRHNMAQEAIQRENNNMTQLNQSAANLEKIRHDLADENIKREEISAQRVANTVNASRAIAEASNARINAIANAANATANQTTADSKKAYYASRVLTDAENAYTNRLNAQTNSFLAQHNAHRSDLEADLANERAKSERLQRKLSIVDTGRKVGESSVNSGTKILDSFANAFKLFH